MVGVYEGTYEPEVRAKHKKQIYGVIAAGLGLCLLLTAVQVVPVAQGLSLAALVLVIGALLWWAFASKRAGPIKAKQFDNGVLAWIVTRNGVGLRNGQKPTGLGFGDMLGDRVKEQPPQEPDKPNPIR